MSEESPDMSWKKSLPNCAVLLVGLPGGGKTTGAKHLADLGFASVSAGDIVRAVCLEDAVEPTRENLSIYGQRLLKKHGYEHFVDLLMERASGSERVVFEGIRPPEVVVSLKRRIHLTRTVLIEAAESERLDRLLLARGEDEASYRRVMIAPMERDIVDMESLIDEKVENNSDLETFFAALTRAVLPLLEDS